MSCRFHVIPVARKIESPCVMLSQHVMLCQEVCYHCCHLHIASRKHCTIEGTLCYFVPSSSCSNSRLCYSQDSLRSSKDHSLQQQQQQETKAIDPTSCVLNCKRGFDLKHCFIFLRVSHARRVTGRTVKSILFEKYQ